MKTVYVDDIKIEKVEYEFLQIAKDVENNVTLNIFEFNSDFKDRVLDVIDLKDVDIIKDNYRLIKGVINKEIIEDMIKATKELSFDLWSQSAVEYIEDAVKILKYLD